MKNILLAAAFVFLACVVVFWMYKPVAPPLPDAAVSRQRIMLLPGAGDGLSRRLSVDTGRLIAAPEDLLVWRGDLYVLTRRGVWTKTPADFRAVALDAAIDGGIVRLFTDARAVLPDVTRLRLDIGGGVGIGTPQ